LRSHNRAMLMKWIGYVLAVVLIALGVQIIVSACGSLTTVSHLEVKDYLLFIQITMTFVTAIGLAVLSFASSRSTVQLQAQLQKAASEFTVQLQADLARQTAEATTKLQAGLARETATSTAKLQAGLSRETAEAVELLRAKLMESSEHVRAELNKSTEDFKSRLGQIIPKQHEAYHSMWKAVSQYYRALQGYEDGKYAEKELLEADRLCSDAHGQSLLAEPGDVQRFDEFWQEANYLKEEGEAIRQNASGLIELWRSEGRTLGRRYNALREEFSKRLFSG
jgi:hypothetical protein